MNTRIAALAVIVATVGLAGCGHMQQDIADAREAADRAQSSANAAQASANAAAGQAQAANAAAQRAQASADQAGQKADAVSARVDQFIADQQAAQQRRRGRTMASAGERG